MNPEEARLRAQVAELMQENQRLRAGVFEPSVPHVVGVPAAVQPLFERVESTVRQLFGRIDIDPARALIAIDDERYLLVRASAFSIDFRDALAQLYSDRGEREALSIARGFLFDIAHTLGLSDARGMHEKLGSVDPVEKLTGGPIHFAYTGWSQVLIREGSRLSADEDFCLLYEHPYSFEADSYRRAGRTSTGPACIMNAGYSSGWCEQSFGIELSALEVTCKACGDESCQFVMGPPDKLVALAKQHFGVTPRAQETGGLDVPLYFERKRAEEEVRRSLHQLRAAQDDLIRKERLATVGLLVSGVAHEVNTPLGVALTANSVLEEELTGLQQKFEASSLTRADLRAFLERAGQAEGMVRSNLERAAREITRFKRVAVDHATEEQRHVQLGEYLRQTLDSLRPLARTAGLQVSLTTEGELSCVTYPGALAQLLTNFVTNTATHGRREGTAPLHAQVALTRSADQLLLSYQDDGCGMTPEVQARAFQPFFTTRRADGGTGLGLHIVQSLVVDVLKGQIELETAPGQGVRFRVRFPVQPPLSGA